MPGIIPVDLKDRAATPVDHRFVPVDTNDGEGTLVERLSSGSFIGEPRLSASCRVTQRRTKSVLKVTMPKVVSETINGVAVPRVVGASYVEVKFDWAQEHTEAERNNLQGMIADALGAKADQPFLNPVLLGLEHVYS